jgi:hypothetical protein
VATVVNVREGGNNFDLTIPDNLLEIGVDGVSQALMGFPTSKLVFHVLTSPAEGVEQRKAVLTLSINTLSLVQMCQLTLGSLVGGSDQLEAAAAQYQNQLKQILNSIKAPTQGT